MRSTLLALLLAACSSSGRTGGGGDGGMGIQGLASIDIAPPSASLTINMPGGSPAMQKFAATGHFSDGHTEDITSRVKWAVEDGSLGAVDVTGQFTSGITQGGKTTVQAGDGNHLGTAQLTLKFVTARVSTDDGSTAPTDSASKFGGAADPTLAPAVAYPLDGARVPHNLGELEAQWHPAGGADLFEVAFLADTLDLRIYTNSTNANGGRLNLKATEWILIANSTGGATVQMQVRGVKSAAPMGVGTSKTVNMAIGTDDVEGGIYFFSPTPTTPGAIERHAFGDVMGMSSVYFAPQNGAQCVGCHVLTRDGSKMAFTYNGGNGPGGELDVMSKNVLVSDSAMLYWNFASYSPDGTRLAAVHAGKIQILDATSAMPVKTVTDGTTVYGTHPDWSPDGNSLAYVQVAMPTGDDWHFAGGSIVVAQSDGMGGFMPATMLVASNNGDNNYYPSFSPDSKWILFNRSNASSGIASDGDAYDDASATLYVISADGKIGPIRLDAANGATANVTNSWPRWAPFVVKNGENGTLLYFTYSSKRDYGIELVGLAQPQIWMAAFDPDAAAGKLDASSVPFWMPYQDFMRHNHIAQWTTQIVGIN